MFFVKLRASRWIQDRRNLNFGKSNQNLAIQSSLFCRKNLVCPINFAPTCTQRFSTKKSRISVHNSSTSGTSRFGDQTNTIPIRWSIRLLTEPPPFRKEIFSSHRIAFEASQHTYHATFGSHEWKPAANQLSLAEPRGTNIRIRFGLMLLTMLRLAAAQSGNCKTSSAATAAAVTYSRLGRNHA